MKLYKCEMCGKKVLQVQDHHVIPWYLSHDDSDSNIMRLCRSCHRKADASFNNLILYGKMTVGADTIKRTGDRYVKKYRREKQLYCVTLSKYTRYYDILHYNTKTGVVRIIQRWCYIPNKHISRSIINHISSRRKMTKAAAVKGQTTLSGGGIK